VKIKGYIIIMGKCETTIASIGIKILLTDLISQINENNFTIITDLLHRGFIEDDNDYFNQIYSKITSRNKLSENYVYLKEYLINEFTNNGSYHKSSGESIVIPTLDKGCLLDKALLVPLKDILTMDRWGHNRYGSNCISTPMDFDLSINIEKYKEIEKKEIVFILGQHSG
jgi:hypothetical protein